MHGGMRLGVRLECMRVCRYVLDASLMRFRVRVGCVESAFEVRFGVKCVLSPGESPGARFPREGCIFDPFGDLFGDPFWPQPWGPQNVFANGSPNGSKTDRQTDPKRIKNAFFSRETGNAGSRIRAGPVWGSVWGPFAGAGRGSPNGSETHI